MSSYPIVSVRCWTRPSSLVSPLLAAVAFVGALALGNFASAQTPASTAPTPVTPKKILFLSGPKDHGAPGRHEYVLDLKTLAESFQNATNLKGVTTEHIVGKAPTDMAAYKDVAVIVIESSSDRLDEETHPLFPADP